MSWVVCSFCGHDNPLGSHYCNDCGEDLNFTLCGRCEAVNRHTASQCYKCGSLLAEPSPAHVASTTAVADVAATMAYPCPAYQTPATAQSVVGPSEPQHRWNPAAFVALFFVAIAAGAIYYLQSTRNPSQLSAVSADPSPAPLAPEQHQRHDADSFRGGESLDAGVSAPATQMAPSGEPPPQNAVAEPTQVSETATSAVAPRNSPADQAEHAAPTSRGRNVDETAAKKPRKRPVPGAAKRDTSPAFAAIAPLRTPPKPNGNPQPPQECSNAVAALGLCNPSKPNEGK